MSQTLSHEKMTPLNSIISLSSMVEVQMCALQKITSQTAVIPEGKKTD